MKRLTLCFAAVLFATNALATAVETHTSTVACRWVVDVHTTYIHGVPQEGYTTSSPRCEPVAVPSSIDVLMKMRKATAGDLVSVDQLNDRLLSEITVGCLKAVLAGSVKNSGGFPVFFGNWLAPPACGGNAW